MPLVVRLKSRLDAIAAIVMTAKMRASGAGAADAFAPCDGGAISRGATRAKSTPQAIAKGRRHERAPASTEKTGRHGGQRNPRLPARPLTPIARPGRFVPRTSIGMPTGW